MNINATPSLLNCRSIGTKTGMHLAIASLGALMLTVASSAMAGPRSDVRPAQGFAILQDGGAYDAGEFYRGSDGRKIRLYRSRESVVVTIPAAKADALTQAGLRQATALPKLERSVWRAARRLTEAETDAILQTNGVDPLYINEETGGEMMVTQRMVVRLADGAAPAVLAGLNRAWGVNVVAPMHGSKREFICVVAGADAARMLQLCETYRQNPAIAWASPDFAHRINFYYTPTDPLYGDQWHLDNTGQTGAALDADVDAAEAWDHAGVPPGGSPDIVIAIVDSGVDVDHEDLAANMFQNAMEVGGVPGVDDDGNGYVDDFSGWDFSDNDNTPDPTAAGDPNPVGHGTSVAGVVAATEGNGLGGVGVAFGCRILPVKISDDAGGFASSTAVGNAIRYAADMANVLNGSWGVADDPVIHAAIQYATDVKGRPVFFATGNAAAGGFGPCWVKETIAVSAGTRYVEWGYNSSFIAQGEDKMWLDDIVFPDGSTESLESAFPPVGWTTGGTAAWSHNSESKHARGTGCSSGESGGIATNQTSWLRTPQMTFPDGDLTFYYWVDCAICAIGAHGYVEVEGQGTVQLTNVCSVQFDVGFPARYDECIAVGSATDFDFRSPYSQYDETLTNVLDMVTSSDGGNGFIITTDIAGAQGYDPGNYMMKFGGTSAASPLAAGIAALVLSKNPNLTAAEVKSILEDSADPIGCQSYDGFGYNNYYGHGRLNADMALALTPGGSAGFFDFDEDGDVDLNDYAAFFVCLNGPVDPPAPGCPVDADVDGNGHVDLIDFGAFQMAFSG